MGRYIFYMFFLLFMKMGTAVPKNHNLFSHTRDRFYEIEKNTFFRSRQLSARKLASYMKRFGIKTVINLRGENGGDKWWREEHAIARELKINYYNIAMSARRFPYKKDLLFLLELYESAPRPVLIHCNGGSDRTGEAAALWVLEQQNGSKKKALKQLTFGYGHVRWLARKKRKFIKLWARNEKVRDVYLKKDGPEARGLCGGTGPGV